jgi:hypothetical protein
MGNQSKRLRIGIGVLTGLLAAAGFVGFILLAIAAHT